MWRGFHVASLLAYLGHYLRIVRFGRRGWQVGDVEAVVVFAPFALAKHNLRNFLDRKIRKGLGVGVERLAANEQRALVPHLFGNSGKLLMCQVLRRDVNEVGFR